jgi:hypothetical protein
MDKYILRQQLLRIVVQQEPAAADLESVMAAPFVLMSGLTRAEAMTEVEGLIEHGYLRWLTPGRSPLWRITAKGRDQLAQETDLDEFVWGRFAGKFAKGE